MTNKIEALAEKVNPYISQISQSDFLRTLTAGTMGAFPAIMAGSFASVLVNLQIPAYQNFLQMTGIGNILNLIILCTVNVFALYVTFCVAYNYAKNKEQSPLPAGVLALAAYLICTPFASEASAYGTSYSIPLTWLGGSGNITALIVGFVTGAIYVFATKKGWTIKLPESVPPMISQSFSSIVPGVLILTFFGILANAFTLTSFGSLHQAIYSCLQAPLQGVASNVWVMMGVTFLSQFLWVFGIHGPMVVIPIMATLWSASDLENLAAFATGQPLPHIAGMAFFQVMTFAGGGIGLALNMLIAKSERYKTLGKLAVVPATFGITEPLIFGTPIVMNMKMVIPQTLIPTLSVGLGYMLTVMGIIPAMSGASLPTGTPVIVAGLLQGSWKLALMHAGMVVLWTLAYRPFFKSLDNEAYAQEQSEADNAEENEQLVLTSKGA